MREHFAPSKLHFKTKLSWKEMIQPGARSFAVILQAGKSVKVVSVLKGQRSEVLDSAVLYELLQQNHLPKASYPGQHPLAHLWGMQLTQAWKEHCSEFHFTLFTAGSCGWQWLFLVNASFWQYCFSTLGLKLSYSGFKGMPLWQSCWVPYLGWNMVQEDEVLMVIFAHHIWT